MRLSASLLLFGFSLYCTNAGNSFPFTASDLFVHPAEVFRICRTPQRRNYVLGLARTMSPIQLCPFVRSWKTFSRETEIILFSDEKIPFLEGLPGVSVVVVRSPKSLSWYNWRFAVYGGFLRACRKCTMGVMFSDVRDVVLQSDVWQNPSVIDAVRTETVIFTLEGDLLEVGSSLVSLRHQPLNKEWIETCLAEKYINATLEGAVSCAGTIIGGSAAMFKYAQQFLKVLFEIAQPTCNDQGVHNFLINYMKVFNQLSFNARALQNGESPIYTIGFGLPVSIDVLAKVHVTRGVRTFTPCVLHQYDRSPSLFANLTSAYGCSSNFLATFGLK
jgi:hypothetical protein